MWAALAVIVLWLAAILAYAYEDGMNLFELMGQFSRHLEYPFAIGWKPHTPKFMAVALLLYAMGIAMYGMFIAIITPPARKDKAVLFTVGLAIAASFAFSYLPVLNLISGGWAIILITIIASAVAAWKFPIEVEEEV